MAVALLGLLCVFQSGVAAGEHVDPSLADVAAPPAPLSDGDVLEAELFQRGDGSWAISRITLAEDGALAADQKPLTDFPEFAAVLKTYRRALLYGDFGRLSKVWVMNPVEREQMRDLLNGGRGIDVKIAQAKLAYAGGTPVLHFVQDVRARSKGGPASPAGRRKLSSNDEVGDWTPKR